MKDEAEKDFLAFVRMMWPVLEPERPLIEGWLLDLLCLPFETEVITEDGPMAIGQYVEDGCRARVLSFDHLSGKPDWKNVKFRQKSQGKPLVKLSLCDTMLSMTDDHPVFVKGRGYVRVCEVSAGETLLCVRKLRRDIPALAWIGEKRLLQAVLSLSASHEAGSGSQAPEMRRMRQDFLAGAQENQILQHGLLGQAEATARNEKMPELRELQKLGGEPVSQVRCDVSHYRHGRVVRKLWQNIMDYRRKAAQILRSGLLWAWKPRREQCRVHPWRVDEEISDRILANAAQNPQARWTGLFPLSCQGRASHPSHRSGRGKQRSGQLGDALPYLPSDPTRSVGEVYTVVESPVLAVEREIRIPDTVYNLAVEGNHNYFANGILVHNCDVLMAISDGDMTRVSINVPPGSTKSTLLNVLWPAWEWGPCNRPALRYMSVSYSTDVPVRDNLRFARILKHPVYQSCWGDRVKITREGAEWVGNDKTGFKMVTSTSGGTTGFRGDRLLLDDLNNPVNVESDIVRASTNKFIREVMPDRLNDLKRSAIVNLQQRTHENDATGTLIEHGQGYQYVCVPMEFDPLRICRVVLRHDDFGNPERVWVDPRALDEHGRQLRGLSLNERGEPKVVDGSPMAMAAGESCWPERFDEEATAKLKLEKGDYAWSAQYQQIPGVRGGAIIKRDWWKLWQGADYPELGTVVVSLDTAIEESEINDYNACTAWGAFAGKNGEPQFLLLEAWRDRMSLADLVRRVAETCRKRKADYLLVERKTRGKDVSDEILRLYARTSWNTELIIPQGDKVSRLRAVSHFFSGDARKIPDGFDEESNAKYRIDWSGGVVFAPDRAWADEVISEVASFPYGANDDYVDSVSQALGWVRKNGVVCRKVEYEEAEEDRMRYRKPVGVPYAIR